MVGRTGIFWGILNFVFSFFVNFQRSLRALMPAPRAWVCNSNSIGLTVTIGHWLDTSNPEFMLNKDTLERRVAATASDFALMVKELLQIPK
jgi:hypothetical protein